MKTPKTSKQRSPDLRNRILSSRNRSILPSACAFALALGILPASNASAEVIAGWDTWSDLGSDTYDATVIGGGGSAYAAQAVGTAVLTDGTNTWPGWANWGSPGNDNGASSDGTWGSIATATPPTTDVSLSTAAVGLKDKTPSGEMTFTITNNSGNDVDLTGFHFDGIRVRTVAPNAWAVSVLAGSAVTEGLAQSGTIKTDNSSPFLDRDNVNIDLTGLADRRLEAGQSVIFELAFTGGAGGVAAGGNNTMIDNVAVTADPATDYKLVITQVPGTATAGVDFSPAVIVQVQDSGNQPFNVLTATDIILNASGAGILSGNTATIPAGENSVTLNTVQYTKAEDITLTAARTSGDIVNASDPSSTITVSPDVASQLIVETAADGTGVPVAAQTLNPPDSITVYAISRDDLDNFVANEVAAWSLENITGNIVSGDLIDNTNGSATFTAADLGTANIRAAFGSLPDADSGLITVEEFVHRWTGAGANGNWGTAGNWTDGILPAFDNTTDLFFSAPTNTKPTPYIGAPRTVRSITFDTNSTSSFSFSFVTATNTSRDLIFDTDSATEPAKINVDAAFTGVATMGFTPSSAGSEGDMILADNLLVTHNGSANLVINADITGPGGSYGITLAGTGRLVISGTNSYTGDTTVNGGTLAVSGNSIPDTGNLIIDGGLVDLTGDEAVATLTIGAGPALASGIYSSDGAGGTIANANLTGTGLLYVGVPIPTGYSSWATDNVDGQDPDEDFNLDGVDNGIAYFMNDTGIITLPGIVGGEITWLNGGNIPSSAYGSEFVVQTSQTLTLGSWMPVPVESLTTNTDSTLTYTPPTGQGKWFVRLMVTPN